MFLYLLLLTAVITTSDTPDTPEVDPELQEIITLITANADEETAKTIIASNAPITDKISASALDQEEAPAPITITNAIEPSMLAYKHWTGTYSPDKFIITINGIEVAQGANVTIKSSDPLEISYNYSFMNGMRSGAKKVSYQLNENSTHAQITFSWKDNWKILVDNGTPVKQEEIV